jgi:hypothetical protein
VKRAVFAVAHHALAAASPSLFSQFGGRLNCSYASTQTLIGAEESECDGAKQLIFCDLATAKLRRIGLGA